MIRHKGRQGEVTDRQGPAPEACSEWACAGLVRVLKMGSDWEERAKPMRENWSPKTPVQTPAPLPTILQAEDLA